MKFQNSTGHNLIYANEYNNQSQLRYGINNISIKAPIDLSPLKYFVQKPLLRSSMDHNKNENFIVKKQKYLDSYNPLIDIQQQIIRPEYIIKQKNIYSQVYNKQLEDHGFKRRQGAFQNYVELLNQNNSILNDRQASIEKLNQNKKKIEFPKLTPQLLENDLKQSFIYRRKRDNNYSDRSQLTDIEGANYKNFYEQQNNLYNNHLQNEIDKQQITSDLNTKKIKIIFQTKRDKDHELKQILQQVKSSLSLDYKNYEIDKLASIPDYDELQDVISKVQYIDNYDAENFTQNLSEFEQKIKDLKQLKYIQLKLDSKIIQKKQQQQQWINKK